MHLHTNNFWSFGALPLEKQKLFWQLSEPISAHLSLLKLYLLAIFCYKEGRQMEPLFFLATAKETHVG